MLLKGKNNYWFYLAVALFTGILLWLAWPPFHTAYLSFIGLAPLLFINDTSKDPDNKGFRAISLTYLTFLFWNIFTTWWIWYASPGGAVLAIVLNALLMTVPFSLFNIVKVKAGKTIGYISLICFWLSFEYIHLHWELTWPWLTLGNVWAGLTDWVQWYEYTGALGGSLWILVVNILIYEGITVKAKRNKYLSGALLLIIAPCLISIATLRNVSLDKYPMEKGNIVVVQPNIDPYNMKFDASSYEEQLKILISLSEKEIDDNTKVVIWPETALSDEVYEKRAMENQYVYEAHEFLKRHPKIKLLSGIDSKTYYNDKNKTITSDLADPERGIWEDHFNTALLMDTSNILTFYHKSMLVPGVEKIPYPQVFGIFNKYIIANGGYGGSLGSQDEPSVFKINDSLRIAPVICYESVFGDYVSKYIRKDANMIAIITNDGWWDNTPGHIQHLEYGALRAIEFRRFIARAANTGISCFILPDGKIIEETPWWEPRAIKANIISNNKMTFYALYGDYIGRGACWLAAGLILYIFFYLRIKKKKILEK